MRIPRWGSLVTNWLPFNTQTASGTQIHIHTYTALMSQRVYVYAAFRCVSVGARVIMRDPSFVYAVVQVYCDAMSSRYVKHS
jgi:hypothetical protein